MRADIYMHSPLLPPVLTLSLFSVSPHCLRFLPSSPIFFHRVIILWSPPVDPGRLNQHIQTKSPTFEVWSTFPEPRREPGQILEQISFPPWDSNWYSLQFWWPKTLDVGSWLLSPQITFFWWLSSSQLCQILTNSVPSGTDIWILPMPTPYSTAEWTREKVFLIGFLFW